MVIDWNIKIQYIKVMNKTKLTINVFLIIFVFFLSCSKNNNNKVEKIENLDFEVSKVFLKEKEKFNHTIQILSRNPNLNYILRQNAKNNPTSKNLNYEISYLFRANEKFFEINLPLGFIENEKTFWQKDFSDINGIYTNSNLKSFLKENDIAENDFRDLIYFLIKYDLYIIHIRPNEEIIYIEEEYNKGIYYDPETTDVKPDLSPNAKIERLEEHWYIYDDNRDIK